MPLTIYHPNEPASRFAYRRSIVGWVTTATRAQAGAMSQSRVDRIAIGVTYHKPDRIWRSRLVGSSARNPDSPIIGVGSSRDRAVHDLLSRLWQANVFK